MSRVIFNEQVLFSWKQFDAENWRSYAREILLLFLDIAPVQFRQLTDSWSMRNIEGIRRAAHTLKSSCGNVGAEAAQHIFEQIEAAARENEMKTIETLMNQAIPLFNESLSRTKQFAIESKLQAA